MNIRKCLVGVCFALGLSFAAKASDGQSGIPKIAITCDFNTLLPSDDAFGLRMQLYSNNKFFSHKERKKRSFESTLAYAYGVGIGGYSVQTLETKGEDNILYHTYAVLKVSYRNQSYFEPFAGIYPGFAWGADNGFFVNPTAGVDVTAFRINRNWNSQLLQAYVQFRVEYNTMLSYLFFGVGLVFQFP